jgi:hypothetical protein
LNAIRTNRLLRIAIVTMALFGWFVLSNHCALGRVAQQAQAKKEHACCHNGTSQPGKEPTPGNQGVQCCKSLHAVVPGDAKLPVGSSLEILVLPIAWPVFAVALADLCAATPATGPPPDVPAFAELVLHRSLRSLAPPFLA